MPFIEFRKYSNGEPVHFVLARIVFVEDAGAGSRGVGTKVYLEGHLDPVYVEGRVGDIQKRLAAAVVPVSASIESDGTVQAEIRGIEYLTGNMRVRVAGEIPEHFRAGDAVSVTRVRPE